MDNYTRRGMDNYTRRASFLFKPLFGAIAALVSMGGAGNYAITMGGFPTGRAPTVQPPAVRTLPGVWYILRIRRARPGLKTCTFMGPRGPWPPHGTPSGAPSAIGAPTRTPIGTLQGPYRGAYRGPYRAPTEPL